MHLHLLSSIMRSVEEKTARCPKKEKWKPYLDYVLKEQEWLKEHQEQELKEIRSKTD